MPCLSALDDSLAARSNLQTLDPDTSRAPAYLQALCDLLIKSLSDGVRPEAFDLWAGLLFLCDSKRTHKQLLSCSKHLPESGQTAFLKSVCKKVGLLALLASRLFWPSELQHI